MKFILWSFLLCSLLSLRAGIQLKDCAIYVDPSAPPSVKMASAELQKYLKLATGAELSIVNKPQTPMIALGDNPAARKAGIEAEKLAYEEYIIRTVDGNLYVAGRDVPNDGKTEFFGDSFGTRYAVQDFLENIMGISWLIPGERGIYIPKLSTAYEIKDLNIRYKPRFEHRFLLVNWPFNRDVHDWLCHNRMVPDTSHFSGSRYLWNNHSWTLYYPEKGQADYDKYNKTAADTYRDNPEFFGMNRNGLRVAPVGQFDLCLSNQKLIDDFSARIPRFRQRQSNAFKGWGDYKYACVQPNDFTPKCQCKQCQAVVLDLDPKKTGELAYQGNVRNWSPLVFDFFRKICEKNPDYLISGYAYAQSEFPYPKMKPMPRNFICMMAPLHTGYGPVRLYEPVNQSWHNWQKSWDGIFREQIYYGADFWFNQNCGAPMSPYPEMMKETFHALLARPYVGAFMYQNKGYGHSGLYMWMMMKLLWNPQRDPYELMDEYLEKAYGKKAAPHIRGIYNLAEKKMKEFVTKRKGKTGYNISPELLSEVYASAWPEYEKMYSDALNNPGDDNQKWRLDMFGENLKLLYYHLSCLKMIDGTKPSILKMSDEEFQKFNGKRKNDKLFSILVSPPPTSGYFDGAKKPVTVVSNVKIPNPEPVAANNLFRYHKDIVVYAPADGFGEIKLEYVTSNNPFTKKKYLPEIGYFSVFNMDASLHYSGIAHGGMMRFPVTRGKAYYLFISGHQDYMSSCRWKIVSSNLPYALGQFIDPNGIAVSGITSPMYFNVRKNTPEFKIYLTDSPPIQVEVVDPSGKVVVKIDKKVSYDVVTVKQPVPGWWKLRFTKPGRGLEGYVRFSNELDGYVVIDPEKALLVERK